jgi:hypothetical protein
VLDELNAESSDLGDAAACAIFGRPNNPKGRGPMQTGKMSQPAPFSGSRPRVDTETICVANIGPKGRRRRLIFGAAFLGLGVLAVAALIAGGASWFWSAALFLPLWVGALGLFQATGQT